LQKKAHT